VHKGNNHDHLPHRQRQSVGCGQESSSICSRTAGWVGPLAAAWSWMSQVRCEPRSARDSRLSLAIPIVAGSRAIAVICVGTRQCRRYRSPCYGPSMLQLERVLRFAATGAGPHCLILHSLSQSFITQKLANVGSINCSSTSATHHLDVLSRRCSSCGRSPVSGCGKSCRHARRLRGVFGSDSCDDHDHASK